MKQQYLVDTTLLVEVLRGNEKAKLFLEARPAISTVSVAELICGSKNKTDLRLIEKVARFLPQVKVDAVVSDEAISLIRKYFLSHGLLFLDALIAASAMRRKKTLVTANMKDFKFIAGLIVISQKEALGKLR